MLFRPLDEALLTVCNDIRNAIEPDKSIRRRLVLPLGHTYPAIDESGDGVLLLAPCRRDGLGGGSHGHYNGNEGMGLLE